MTNKNIDYLNENYHGKFEQLTGKEREYYSNLLNKSDNVWYDPYAIRRETNDIICVYDTCTTYGNALFVGITDKQLYQG